MTNRIVASLLALLLIVGAGIGGYALGHSNAPDEQDASAARERAFSASFISAKKRSFAKARASGIREGLKAGTKAGGDAGATLGSKQGASAVSDKQEELVAAADAAAAADASDDLVYCTLGENRWCTVAERDQAAATESYCGGYDPAQVQPDGTYIPKPGC